MGDKSEIQWTDATWNPVTGCSKVSPGCAHCYAESLTMRYHKGWKVPGLPWTPANADQNVILKPERLDQPLRWTKPRMIFVNSMSDLFHEKVPEDYIAEVFAVMDLASQHIFQVLTKRPERMRDLLNSQNFWMLVLAAIERRGELRIERGEQNAVPNVWLGTSIENRRFVGRADALRETPAAVRFISAEPLLGPLIWDDVERVGQEGGYGAAGPCWSDGSTADALDLTDINWLIVGGESGPGHRPMQRSWVEQLMVATRCERCLGLGSLQIPDGCFSASSQMCPACNGSGRGSTAFFFKQWGGRTPKAGGRELDGREWNEMPAALSPAEEVSPA